MSAKDTPKKIAVSARDESDVYDRQIRLWGAEAQSKMSSAKVLYVHVSGVSSEILKNLVLAGVHAAICDGRPYPAAMSHTPSSFLPPGERISIEKDDESSAEEQKPSSKKRKKMSVAQAMQPHVHELNPLLEECEIKESIPLIDGGDDDYFSKFDIVIASQIGMDDAVRISNATTSAGGKFYFVHCFGWYGCAMIDLGQDHQFRKEVGKDKLSDLMTVDPYLSMEKMSKIPLRDVKDRWHKDGPPKVWAMFRAIMNYYQLSNGFWPSVNKADDFVIKTKDFLKESGIVASTDDCIKYLGDEVELKQLAAIATAELSPVCAVMGGVLGNEVIKAISGKGEPANNILLFDGRDGSCKSFTLKEK